MAKQINLITGEPFLIQQEITKWMSAFRAKFNPESIFVYANHPLDTKAIINTINGGWGLFATKSCIFVHGLPLSSEDKKWAKEKEELDKFIQWFSDNYKMINSDTIIIFISSNPDKRGKLYKLFDSAWLDSNLWIINRSAGQWSWLELVISQLGERCTTAQCQQISDLISTSDLYRIRYETSKIKDYIEYHQWKTPTINQIKEIITPHIDQDNFAVIDSVLYKSSEDTLRLIDRLQQVDDNPYGFLWLLYRWLRGVIMTVDAMNHDITNSSQLMSLTKLPPFTVGKIVKNYDSIKYRLGWLQSLFSSLILIEHEIKNWLTPVEIFWPYLKTKITKLSI